MQESSPSTAPQTLPLFNQQGVIKSYASDLFTLFSVIISVALADQCYHRSARFRHRNMYLIRVDHLPLDRSVVSVLVGLKAGAGPIGPGSFKRIFGYRLGSPELTRAPSHGSSRHCGAV
ncbi:unnamed protein product, partial [Adineta ricciae]